MKRPIEPSEIRKGDLIRCEALDADGFGPDHILASEFRAEDRFYKPVLSSVRYYLLDRPVPAVVLPAEPTLGWVGHSVRPAPGIPPSILAYWHQDETGWFNSHDGRGFTRENITAFVPATAVPTDALDKLRGHSVLDGYGDLMDRVGDFLAAVDEANGDRA